MNWRNSANTILLAGSGRSGTTWLGNIIGANPGTRIIFEPFDRRRVPQAKDLPLRPYARPDGRYPHWYDFVGDVLTDQIGNDWTNQQRSGWWARRLLIKEIRANLLLGWIDHCFHPRIVLMTRHPCAVVLSRVRLGWETHIDELLSQPELVEDYLSPYIDVIDAAETAVQRHAVMWCVENLVPLHHLSVSKWVFCTYENLYRQPEIEARRVLQALGIRYSWFSRRAVRQISRVTRPDSPLVAARDPLTSWQHELGDGEIEDVMSIVRAFGITLYGEGPLPQIAREYIR